VRLAYCIILRIRYISKSQRESKYTFYAQKCLSENPAVYEIMWKDFTAGHPTDNKLFTAGHTTDNKIFTTGYPRDNKIFYSQTPHR